MPDPAPDATRSSNSEAKADRHSPAVTRTTPVPSAVSSNPNTSGALASAIRVGTDRMPLRLP